MKELLGPCSLSIRTLALMLSDYFRNPGYFSPPPLLVSKQDIKDFVCSPFLIPDTHSNFPVISSVTDSTTFLYYTLTFKAI